VTLHILVMEPSESVNITGVQQTITGHGGGWYRFGPGSWIISSVKGAQYWVDLLTPFVPPSDDGKIFVCHLNMGDRQGLMPPKFWQWVSQQQQTYY